MELQTEAEISGYIDSKLKGFVKTEFDRPLELPEGQYWVVYVSDRLELPNGEVSLSRRRFEFKGEGASIAAWECYQNAKRHGFTARAEKVRKV